MKVILYHAILCIAQCYKMLLIVKISLIPRYNSNVFAIKTGPF